MDTTTTYQWLEPKPYKRFTRQLGIKGRNMLVWHLVAGVVVRGETPEFVAEDYRLPVEAVQEALDYYSADSDLLITYLQRAGHQVFTPRTERTAGADDPVHLAHAAANSFTLITKDPDDYTLLHQEWQQQGQAHSGILLIYEENIRGKNM